MNEEDIEKFKEELLENPYKFICDYVEEILPYVGKVCFEILSLSIPSLIIPDILYEGKFIRSNINVLFLANPGSGKTQIAQQFSFFAYNSQDFESVTTARFEDDLKVNPEGTLVVGDCSRILRDPFMIKTIEGILEEKKVNRKTKKHEVVENVNYVGLLCGTPQDLTGLLTGGLLFRFVPIILFHTTEQHSEIGRYINNRIFEEDNISIKEKLIKGFFETLLSIQMGENQDIKKVTGYKVSENFKKKIYETWEKITSHAQFETQQNWFRELHEYYRFLLSHAFLNIFNRKVDEYGILYPNEEDLEIATKLFKKTTIEKIKLLKSERIANQIDSVKRFKELIGEEQNNNRIDKNKKYIELFTSPKFKK